MRYELSRLSQRKDRKNSLSAYPVKDTTFSSVAEKYNLCEFSPFKKKAAPWGWSPASHTQTNTWQSAVGTLTPQVLQENLPPSLKTNANPTLCSAQLYHLLKAKAWTSSRMDGSQDNTLAPFLTGNRFSKTARHPRAPGDRGPLKNTPGHLVTTTSKGKRKQRQTPNLAHQKPSLPQSTTAHRGQACDHRSVRSEWACSARPPCLARRVQA